MVEGKPTGTRHDDAANPLPGGYADTDHEPELLPMVFVPPLAKLISDADSKPIPMGRWLMVLGLLLLAEVAIDYREVWFPGRGYAQAGMLIFVLAIVFAGELAIMRWRKES